MSWWAKNRFLIYSQAQHPYRHSLNEFGFTSPVLPGVTNVESAMNWILAVLYPNSKDPVATPGDLPTGVNTPNPGDVTPTLLDYRVVTDDGDGKSAAYRWEQREGDVSPKWYKIYDMDWGEQSILSNFLTQTQDMYVFKYGTSDTDENGDVLTGNIAGQHIYGGDLANQHLTLHANSGDAPGVRSGFIQFDDSARPTVNNLLDLGTLTEKFRSGFFETSLLSGNITISAAQISSSTGAIGFDNENLSTTGTLAAGVTTINGHLILAEITTPATPAASFDALYFKADGKLYRLDSSGTEKLVGLEFASTNDNRLIRSNGTGGSAIQESGITVDDSDAITGVTSIRSGNIVASGNTISTADVNGNLVLAPNGTGKVQLATLRHTALTNDAVIVPRTDGTFTSTGISIDGSNNITGALSLAVGNLSLSGNTLAATNANGNVQLSSLGTGNVILNSTLRPTTDLNSSLGSDSQRFSNIRIGGNIGDGTDTISISTILSLRSILPANNNDSLFYSTGSGTFLPADVNTKVDHGSISGLSDDDHSQYMLLAGRSGGQSLIGGTAVSANLTLESTANATKGLVLTKDNFGPFTNASYSAGWSGTDLGDSTHYFRDVYTKGEFFGFRFENLTSGTLPTANAENVGRAVWTTDTNKLYVSDGSQFRVAGVGKFVADQAFNGTDLTKTIDVSSQIQDARNCVIQLLDNASNFERIYCKIEAISASDVRITTTTPLPAGNYRLIVIE